MSLLDTLKSLLGLGSSRGEPRRSDDVGVTVERDPESDSGPPKPPSSPGGGDEPDVDAETEHEVKGTDEATGAGSAAATDDDASDGGTDEDPADGAAGDEPTTDIKGIGSSYADRLADAGVETVADLADADPESLADETDISEKRLGRWVERAANR